MDYLGDKLQTIRKLLNKHTAQKQDIQKAIFIHTKIEVPEEYISAKNGVVRLNISSAEKMAVKLKEKYIIQTLSSWGSNIQSIV